MRKSGDRVGFRYYSAEEHLVCKTCLMCFEVYTVDKFGKHSYAKDGLSSKCRECLKTYNSEKYLKKILVNPEYKKIENSKISQKLMTRTDSEVISDRVRLRTGSRKSCRKCRRSLSFDEFDLCRGNYDGLQHTCRVCRRNDRWDKTRGVHEEYWTAKDISLSCYVSGCEEYGNTSDHVIPIELEGPDILSNLLPQCNSHNSGKNSRSLLKWLQTYHPESLYGTLTTVLSYGVSPWTYLDTPEEISTILTELEQYRASVL